MKNLEEFKQICAGPVWDGDLISKDGRDALVKAGYVARCDGWNFLTGEGVAVAVAFGLLSTNRGQKPPGLDYEICWPHPLMTHDAGSTSYSVYYRPRGLCKIVLPGAHHVQAVKLNDEWFVRQGQSLLREPLDDRWRDLKQAVGRPL